VIQSSRKEWEEELTSTQNLGVSASAKKLETSQGKNKAYVEPTIKLQNFVAADARPAVAKNNNLNPNSRFTSSAQGTAQKRKVSEMTEEDEDYSEDFDSLSKSQAGLSMSRVSVKKGLKSGGDDGGENSYSNDFESIGESKTLSNEATINCFMCKQQIPKSQAL